MQQTNSKQFLSYEVCVSVKKNTHAWDNAPSQVNNSKIQKKRFWTEAEDRILQIGVQKYGNKKWSQISKLLKNRHPKRCRERWFNYLTEKNKSWTNEDMWLLFLAYKIHGNKWSEISKIFERGDNVVKNKIICLKRKGLCEFEERLEQILGNQEFVMNIPSLESSLEFRLLEKLIQTRKGEKRCEPHPTYQVQRLSDEENFKQDFTGRQNSGEFYESCIYVQPYQFQYPYHSYCAPMIYCMMPLNLGGFS